MTGVGVDDTRMDLSQFDEGRSGSMTGNSASQPDIIITAGSSDELEQTAPLEGGTESSDVMPTAETTHRWLWITQQYKLMQGFHQLRKSQNVEELRRSEKITEFCWCWEK